MLVFVLIDLVLVIFGLDTIWVLWLQPRPHILTSSRVAILAGFPPFIRTHVYDPLHALLFSATAYTMTDDMLGIGGRAWLLDH